MDEGLQRSQILRLWPKDQPPPSEGQIRAQSAQALVGQDHRALAASRRGGLRLAWLAFFDDGRELDFTPVRKARRNADFVFVSVHWGAEYSAVTNRQRRLARSLAQSGADVILGSGPHVLQESARIGRTLVLYSLGNFVFDGDMPATRKGAIVLLDVRRGRVSACAVPTETHFGRVTTGEVSPRVLKLPGCA